MNWDIFCILAIIFVLAMFLGVLVLFRDVVPGIPLLENALRLYRQAEDGAEKGMIFMFIVIKVLRGGYIAALGVVPLAAIAAVVTICTGWDSVVREILLEVVRILFGE